MKNQLLNVFRLYLFALSGQSTPEVIVALGSTAIAGLAGLLALSPFYR